MDLGYRRVRPWGVGKEIRWFNLAREREGASESSGVTAAI